MATNYYTIALREGGVLRKITKLLFASDGSYMVMVPYHSSSNGVLFKLPVGYSEKADETQKIPFTHVIDAGEVDEKRIKLSHHRSGFIQFSGEGVVSGLDENGAPRGIGLQSWTLDDPAQGPSFGITFLGIDEFAQAKTKDERKISEDGVLFERDELPPSAGNGFILEGFYFSPKDRRFIRQVGNSAYMSLIHPTGIVLDLKVAAADPATCEFAGFVGFTMYPAEVSFGSSQSGYMISSSTGNLQRSPDGKIIGEGLYCAYPDRMKSLDRRSLDYVPSKS
jgi:hypothetical protein